MKIQTEPVSGSEPVSSSVLVFVRRLQAVAPCYLVEVTGTAALQELFVSTHRDAECVDHLVPMMLCCGDDVLILCVQILDLSLKQRTDPGEAADQHHHRLSRVI